jgi:hypothetical protein
MGRPGHGAPAVLDGRLRRFFDLPPAGRYNTARFGLTLGGEPYTPETLSPGGLRFVSIHVGKKRRFTVNEQPTTKGTT